MLADHVLNVFHCEVGTNGVGGREAALAADEGAALADEDEAAASFMVASLRQPVRDERDWPPPVARCEAKGRAALAPAVPPFLRVPVA